MSTLKVNTLEEATSGGATYFTAKAFVSFVGTSNLTPDTLSVRGSGNVSSVSDLGTGDYRANFSNSLSSANFSATMGGGRLNSTSGTSGWQKTWSHATGSIRAMTHNGSSTATDHELIEITVTV